LRIDTNFDIQEVVKKKKILKTRKPKMLLSLFLVMVMLPISSKISANAVVEHYFTGGFPSVDGVYYTYSSGTASTYRKMLLMLLTDGQMHHHMSIWF